MLVKDSVDMKSIYPVLAGSYNVYDAVMPVKTNLWRIKLSKFFGVTLFLFAAFSLYRFHSNEALVADFGTPSSRNEAISAPPVILLEESITELDQYYQFDGVRAVFHPKKSKLNLYTSPKAIVESSFLNAIPKQFKKRVLPLIKPVLVLSQRYRVDPMWVLSIMWTESHFKYQARSRVGAQGLMQVMPVTKRYLKSVLRRKKVNFLSNSNTSELEELAGVKLQDLELKNYRNVLENIELGVYYLSKLYRRFKQNPVHATVAYNMGPSWTRRRLAYRKAVGKRNIYLNKVKKNYNKLFKKYLANEWVAIAQASSIRTNHE